MDMFEYAEKAFADILADCPANGCQARGIDRVDAGNGVPGGWSSARRLAEGLYGGRAIVNVSQQLLDGWQTPTAEVLCDDPVSTAGHFTVENGVMGLKRSDGTYALAYSRADTGICGTLVTARPASLCAAVTDAARLIPDAVAYLLGNGLHEEQIQWAWSCAPVVLTTFEEKAVQATRQEAVSAHGVCSIWVRGDDRGLEDLARGYGACRLRLHSVERARTYGAG